MRDLTLPSATLESTENDLSAALELHHLTMRLLQCDTPQTVTEEMLDALIDYHGADFGTVQFVEPACGGLTIAVQRGFADQFLKTFRIVSSDTPSACGRALQRKVPVVIEDAMSDPEITPYAEVFKAAGVRSVLSAPLIGSDREVIGVISTHFREPRVPPATQTQITALYAQQGTELLRRLRQPAHERSKTAVDWHRSETTGDGFAEWGELAAFYRKVGQFSRLSADQLPLLQELICETREFDAEVDFICEGDAQNDCFIMLEGWGYKYKALDDGMRQIVHFPLPGDFVGVHGRLFKTIDHSFATVTPAKFGVFSGEQLQGLIEDNPRLGQAILWSAARDEAMAVEHLVSVGRRSAIQSMAHLLLELSERIEFAGLGDSSVYKCPLTQEHLGDALGLTSIHVNRILRKLREKGLVALSKGLLEIRNRQELAALSSFDAEYLDQADE